MPSAFCELDEAEENIEVFFPYDAAAKEALKLIKGWRFIGKDNPKYNPEVGPHWTVPARIENARRLREIFDNGLTLGNAVRAWGRQEVQLERNLKSLTIADDAELERVPTAAPIIARVIEGEPIPEFGLSKKHPLSKRRKPRPYQRADIRAMSQVSIINANQPGVGKSLEAIGALVEAELEHGPQLVITTRASLVNTWKVEINRLQPGVPVFTSENAAERKGQVVEGLRLASQGKPCWILVIYDDVRVVRGVDKPKLEKAGTAPEKIQELLRASMKDPLYARKDHKGSTFLFNSDRHQQLVATEWNSVIIDEFHKSGLNTVDSMFTLGVDILRAQRFYPMSGTPMGGKPIKLFPVLRRIDPKAFSSKWRWADEWLTVEENVGRNGVRYGKSIGKIQENKEEAFYEFHSRYMIRRLKREALPGLPKKVIEILESPMTTQQAKQYAKFEKNAEIVIEGEGGPKLVVGDCILAEFTRLRQFANAFCEVNRRGEIMPTEDSGKLPMLLEKLDEFGIRRTDPEPGARAIVASQYERMVRMVVPWLRKSGIRCGELTGKTKDTSTVINEFKDLDNEEPYVLVMTTDTGGTSLNLEEANSIHILDESWNPDVEEQLEDRGDRGERTTPLVCVYYRTRESIQDYIAQVAEGKKINNANALDVYRQIKKLKGKSND